MTFEAKKIELVKRILNTNDKDIITYIQSVFETEKNWLSRYPDEIKEDIIESKKQIDKNETIPDKEVRKMAKKWLKK